MSHLVMLTNKSVLVNADKRLSDKNPFFPPPACDTSYGSFPTVTGVGDFMLRLQQWAAGQNALNPPYQDFKAQRFSSVSGRV